MGYRFIFSQMFDVRPRTSAGDLDLEKMARLEEFLNLRAEEIQTPGTRTINLRPKRAHLKILADSPIGRTTFSPVRGALERNIDFLAQLYDDNIPEESDILSVFDIIEATDELLKRAQEEEIAWNIPVKNIFVEKPEESVLEVPVSEEPVLEIEQPQFEPYEPEFVFPEVQPTPPMAEPEPILNFEAENSFGREPDLTFWSRPQAEDQTEFVPGSEFLTPEFLLGEEAAKESLGWRARKKPILIFLAAALLIFSFISLIGWARGALNAKNEALNFGFAAYQSLMEAKDSLEKADFVSAGKDFNEAYNYFAAADSQVKDAGGWLVQILAKVPGFSYLSSRLKLIEVGQDMSKAGQEFTAMISLLQKGYNDSSGSQTPFSAVVAQGKKHLEAGLAFLVSARQNMEDIKIFALPEEMRPQLTQLSEKMPQLTQTAAMAIEWTDNFLAILGQQSAKKYLLIFQNNAEMRPTGGFIGTYGLLDVDQGQVKKIFIDGIFNADGQLRENVVPPEPIQKISTAWSMHDANWFADFPTSAKKIMWFYEKTGGPTPDGVISLTPTVIERLLILTGPIDMPEYGVQLSSRNFAELTQYKVEVDYDKELNQPKKILADFAPKFINKVSEQLNKNNIEVVKIINQLLKEKHILIYFSEPSLEEFVKKQGWAGEIKETPQDYLSVINTNINGYKTDKMIEEKIEHWSDIKADGSIIDTIKITRHHQGGNSQFDWYNKVNSDYLRVYVPKGSYLIAASGQTKEEAKPPIDYEQAGFKKDEDVEAQKQSLKKDPISGTEIFEESGKTVFGNWIYVSPGETVTVTYQYRLPFKADLSNPDYSLLVQKQSGNLGSVFQSHLSWPATWHKISGEEMQTELSQDRQLYFTFLNVK